MERTQRDVRDLAERYEEENDETPEGEEIKKIAGAIAGELGGLYAVVGLATGELHPFGDKNRSAKNVAGDFRRTGDYLMRLSEKLRKTPVA